MSAVFRNPEYPSIPKTWTDSTSALSTGQRQPRGLIALRKLLEAPATDPNHPNLDLITMPLSGQSGHIYEEIHKYTPVYPPFPQSRLAPNTSASIRKPRSKEEGFLPASKRMHPNLEPTL